MGNFSSPFSAGHKVTIKVLGAPSGRRPYIYIGHLTFLGPFWRSGCKFLVVFLTDVSTNMGIGSLFGYRSAGLEKRGEKFS